ncbi:hypothetical protein CLV36_11675 [Laceyella sediminis]|uniref:DUF3784 domain-containing protein n=1 Tax=Laceyella sediminis TaxID=573074 RepID=A0ABX5ENI4_9BACL|nr:hypothetical protein CLV36_11675 [Laceyella sediminis]
MSGYHIFFIIVGMILIGIGIFMSRKQIEELKEMMRFDLDPTSFLKMIVYVLIIKLPPIFTRIYFILLGTGLIIFVLFFVYY